MNKTKLASAISTLLITSAIAACGGNSGAGNGTAPGNSITSTGSITQFGSVYVNGVRYETRNTQIISTDDDTVLLTNPTNAQLQAVLGLGQVVTVRGSRSDDSNGAAATIRFDNELAGEVSSVSAMDASFVILGQTVSVTPETIIDDSLIEIFRGTEIPDDLAFGDAMLTETLDQLLPIGSIIVVSGFPSQNGFEATRIEDGTDTTGSGAGSFEAEVKGTVTNLTDSQFELNGLTVLYDSTDLDDEDFVTDPLDEGQFVEVHGIAISTTVLEATRIEREDHLFDDDFDEGELEVEGVVQNIQADNQGTGGIITINGIDIRVDDISPFSEGLHIEIKGYLQSDGTLSISRIKDEAEDSVRIRDRAVSADDTSFITRLGLTITPTDRTRLKDKSIENDDNLSITDFLSSVSGKSIKARGFPLNGEVAWTRLEIKNNNDMDCRLRGPVANIAGDASDFTFTIEGITINSSQVSDSNFESDSSQSSLGRSGFFTELDEGDVVQAKSDRNGLGCTSGELIAREIEFESENDILQGSSDDDDGPDSEIVGTVSNITEFTFDIAGITVTVNDSTLIDDSIIESARDMEVDDEETFGNLTESLNELLSDGMGLKVKVDRTNGIVAVSIEDL